MAASSVPITRSDLSPDLLKEIAPLKVGQMTPVLRTTRGYQIIKLESATETKVKTMDEARAEIADKVAAQKQRGQMQQYIEHLRAQAIIDWKNDEVKKAFEVGVKQQAAEPIRAMTPEWFAIWIRSRHEKMVRDQLAQKDVEVFLPTITKWSRWKDRKKAIDWPLFPGYCFARFDGTDRLPDPEGRWRRHASSAPTACRRPFPPSKSTASAC